MKKYLRNHRRFFTGALLSVLASTIFSTVLQFLKGDVLDHAAAGSLRETAASAAWLFVLIMMEIVGYYLYNRCRARFSAECTGELKRDIVESILSRSYAVFRERAQGEYIAQYTQKVDTVRDRWFDMLPALWDILFKIMLVSAALFVLDPGIAVITLVLLTTPLYIPKLIEKRLQNAQTAYLRAVEDSLVRVGDWLNGFEVIKNFSVERRIMEQFVRCNDTVVEKQLQDARVGAVAQMITTLISYLSYFAVLLCAAYLVLQGKFSAGDFFVAIGMIDQLSYPLISLAGIIRQVVAVRPVCAELDEFLREYVGGETENGVVRLQSEIRFDRVAFSYDGEHTILKEFDLTVRRGRKYLLKGPSGCGKTTAMNLLLRYYEADSGSITVDGRPLDEVGNPYGLITVVRQEATLFRDTLRNNLTMYRDISEERLLAVLHSVGLEKYADHASLEREVAEGGSNFSGGEKKRVCLARALLRDTDVLILDEPLANLDPETADHIEDLLLSILQKTVLIVSHQFTASKLVGFDQIIDFDTMR